MEQTYTLRTASGKTATLKDGVWSSDNLWLERHLNAACSPSGMTEEAGGYSASPMSMAFSKALDLWGAVAVAMPPPMGPETVD
jgi:hypothetical protein